MVMDRILILGAEPAIGVDTKMPRVVFLVMAIV
jgi:hypothetical protein